MVKVLVGYGPARLDGWYFDVGSDAAEVAIDAVHSEPHACCARDSRSRSSQQYCLHLFPTYRG